MPVGWQNRDWAEVRSSPFGFCRVRGFIKMSECQIHGTRIAYFREIPATGRNNGFSRGMN